MVSDTLSVRLKKNEEKNVAQGRHSTVCSVFVMTGNSKVQGRQNDFFFHKQRSPLAQSTKFHNDSFEDFFFQKNATGYNLLL